MFMFTTVLVPGDHQVGQYLTFRSVCKHVCCCWTAMSQCEVTPSIWEITGLKFTLESWTGESAAQVVMKMAHDPPLPAMQSERQPKMKP